MTSEPFRLRIQKALCDVFESITPANGYTNDLTGRVSRGRMIFGVTEDDEVPHVSILEHPEGMNPSETRDDDSTDLADYLLLIQGWVDDDYDNPTDPAHHLVADVLRRLSVEKKRPLSQDPNDVGLYDFLGLGASQKNSGNRILKVTFGRPIVRPPEDGISSKAFFIFTLRLGLIENLEKPFL